MPPRPRAPPALCLPLLVALILTLAGCSSPSYQFSGQPRHEISLQGHRFAVYQNGNEAEVIRLGGWIPRAARRPLPGLMTEAAGRATGCKPLAGSYAPYLQGDTGVARVELICP